MDFDEPLRLPTTVAASLQKEALDDFSIFELEARIEILRVEIARSEQLIASKQASQGDAESIFR
jgi:uncharacterized small protein (DUF1192 family)